MTIIGILAGFMFSGVFLMAAHWDDGNGPGTRDAWWMNAGSVLFIVGIFGIVGAGIEKL